MKHQDELGGAVQPEGRIFTQSFELICFYLSYEEFLFLFLNDKMDGFCQAQCQKEHQAHDRNLALNPKG